jgi:hypothetical protein
MDIMDDADAQARRIQSDIDRTRDAMDHTLTKLEQRLAPEELVQRGTETLRARLRSAVDHTVATVKRHPVPLLAAGAAIAVRVGMRPSAKQRQLRQAEEDFERVWTMLATGVAHAKEQSRHGGTRVAEALRDAVSQAREYAGPAADTAIRLGRHGTKQAARLLDRASRQSRAMTGGLAAEADAHPLAALAVLAVMAGLALRGAR